jgi:hypothetical protein
MFGLRKIRFGATKTVSHCPSCQNPSIYRSRRHGMFESILGGILLLYPYRCQQCDARFYIFGQRRLPMVPVKPQPSGLTQLP